PRRTAGASTAPPPSIMRQNSESGILVAVSSLATVAIEGQRGLPSLPNRFDRLSAVGSSPAIEARRDRVQPCRAATRSTPSHRASWLNMIILRLGRGAALFAWGT